MLRKVLTAALLALFMVLLVSARVIASEEQPDPKNHPIKRMPHAPTQVTIEEAQGYERLIDGSHEGETVQTEPGFVPGSAATQSAVPSGLFNGIFAGNTTYDYQRNGTCHRQIQHGIDPSSGKRFVHVTWMGLNTVVLNDPNRQVYYNCYDWTIPGWTLMPGGITISPAGAREGYTAIDVNSAGNAVVYHHSALVGAVKSSRVARFGIPGMGLFNKDNLVNFAGQEDIWPRGEVSRNPAINGDVYHVGGLDCLPAPNLPAWLVYWRYAYSAGAGMYVWTGPVLIDQAKIPSHVLLTDDNGRVIFAFAKPRPGSTDYYDNDLVYWESTDNGLTWSNCWNVTDYVNTDRYRCFIDVAGGFTSDDQLHLFFTDPEYNPPFVSTGPCKLWHWSENFPGGNAPAVPYGGPPAGFNSANFSVVADADPITNPWFFSMGEAGAWNRWIGKQSMAIGDGSTSCPGGLNLDYLYVVYTQFGGTNILDWVDFAAPVKGRRMQNGNLWMSVSNNKGATWAPQRCITTSPINSVAPFVHGPIGGTPTRSTLCQNCPSEHWSSVAEEVHDTLHVFYVGDLSPGGIPFNEGLWKNNDMMYMPIAGQNLLARNDQNPLCPVIAPVLRAAITEDPDCEYHADLADPVNLEELTIRNAGNDNLDFSIDINYLSGANWMTIDGTQSIPPATIPPDGDDEQYTVEMDGTMLANGLYQAEIRINHNDPELGDPYVIPIDFFVAESFICGSGVVMTTPCVALEVSNTESWGRENPDGGMAYYNEPDDDSLFSPFYDGSLTIANKTRTAVGPETIVYRDIFNNQTPSNPGFRALENPKVYYDAASNDSVVAADQCTVDSTIGISVRYLFPQEEENCEFVRIKFSVYPRDEQEQDLIIGAASDIDITRDDIMRWGAADSDYLPESYGEMGGYVSSYNLIYQHGVGPNTNAFGERLTNKYAAGMTALTCEPAKRMVVQSDRIYVWPNDGFTDQYIYEQLDSNGVSIWNADPPLCADELHSILAIEEITLVPEHTYVYQMALVSSIKAEVGVSEGGYGEGYVADLIETTAKAWKKGFGWCGDFWHTGGDFEFDGPDGEIGFKATGTHEDGIDGGCCGCAFSYEIDPEPTGATITLHSPGYEGGDPCGGVLDFVDMPEGTYEVTLTVDDLCQEQSDQVVFVIDVPSAGCFCGGSPPTGGAPPSFGDITCDTQVNPVDVVKMVNYVYKSVDDRCPAHVGPPPVTEGGWNCPTLVGDVTCDVEVNPVDVVHYVNYVYKNITPFPCDPCVDM